MKIPWSPDTSIYVKEKRSPLFDTAWHFHPEYELTLRIACSGIRCIGQSVAAFYERDLVLIGPNLPHFWRNSAAGAKDKNAHSIVVLFSPDCLGAEFFHKPELAPAASLLDESKRGLRFPSSGANEAVRHLLQLPRESGMKRVILFLEILHLLAGIRDRETLCGPAQGDVAMPQSNERINRICHYIFENFQQPIDLDAAAALVNMSPVPFCRFFKRTTRMTLSDFVNRTRTDYATKLLVETDLAISEICFACGFSSISNFNRRFRELIGVSPSDYRARFQRDVPLPPEEHAPPVSVAVR